MSASRREKSPRQDARERYVALAAREKKEVPTPDPSPQGGGEQQKAPSLMQRLRGLYENSAVPVREVARLAGVSERTLYKYVEKGGWRRRHACAARDAAVKAANNGRRLLPTQDFAPAKGAGGRFIRREDKGKPFASGISALDPAGAERAASRCEHAEKLSAKAQRQTQAAARCRAALAQAAKERQARARILDYALDTLLQLARVAAELRRNPGRGALAAAAERAAQAMLDWVERSRSQERAGPSWQARSRRS
jgi:hypothetical protein